MRPSVLRRSPRTGPLDAAEQRRKRDQFDRIVERMRAVLGEVEVAAPEDGTARFYGEVSHLETGLQVTVFAGSGAVTFAYWEHEDRRRPSQGRPGGSDRLPGDRLACLRPAG